MTYSLNTIIATLVNKEDAPKASVGVILAIRPKEKKPEENEYLVELFNVKGHVHDQIWYNGDEIYEIQ